MILRAFELFKHWYSMTFWCYCESKHAGSVTLAVTLATIMLSKAYQLPL